MSYGEIFSGKKVILDLGLRKGGIRSGGADGRRGVAQELPARRMVEAL